MEEYDFVIVGAGTAGCVLAYRLGEQGHSVCVIEAGPPDSSPYIRIPAGFMKTYSNPKLTWQLRYQGCSGTNGREIPFTQGKTLGGSSAVNGTVYSRGQAFDFNNWAELGNRGWAFADVLPFFQKSEHFQSPDDSQHRGQSGPIPVTRSTWASKACEQFIQGAVESGIPANEDYNGRSQAGVSRTQAVIHKGRRWSAAHGYLHPAVKAFKVNVVTNAIVKCINFKDRRATGVSYARPGDDKTHEVRARLATIVSAGATNSPKLLQISGVGPAQLLSQHGIPIIQNSSGVGENLRDHYAARIVVRAKEGVDTINRRARGLPLIYELLSWLVGRPSILAISSILAYGFWKTDVESPESNFALSFTPASFKAGMTRQLDEVPGFTIGAWKLRPESRGYVRIASGDPFVLPTIQPNFLDARSDQETLVAALKWARRVSQSDAMKLVVDQETFPGASCATDEDWLGFARQFGMSAYHLVGTCKMGPDDDPLAVVDSSLKVRGVDALYVIDASVMPTSPSANTAAATMMIAEKAAEMIRAGTV